MRNHNLLGDCLYTLRPLAELHMQRQEEIVVGVGAGFAGEMVRRQFQGLMTIVDAGDLPADAIDLGAGAAAKLGRAWRLENRPRHISYCYALILGVNTDHWQGDVYPLTGWVRERREVRTTPPYAIIAPFSRSCSSHNGMRPNKTLAGDERWEPLLRWLWDNGIVPYILTGPGEEWHGSMRPVRTATAGTLDDLTLMLSGASVVISVDNGIGHIASALGCTTYILWPPVTDVTFIGPTYNPSTKLLYMRPERIRAEQLLSVIKKELEIDGPASHLSVHRPRLRRPA